MKRLLALFCVLLLLGGCSLLPPLPTPGSSPEPSEEPEVPPQPGLRSVEVVPIPDDGKFTLRYSPEDSLNPFSCLTETNRILCPLLYETLLGVSPEFQPESGLCTSCVSEDGGQSFRLVLREGACFSDGSPISAWDAAYSLNRAREDTSFYAGRLGSIREVSVSGEGLLVTLSSPNPSFPLRLDIPVVREGTAYRNIPTGSGPYVFTEEEEGTVCLLPNACAPAAAALPFERIELRAFSVEESPSAFAAGELDLLAEEPGVRAPNGTEGAIRRSLPTSVLYYVALNPGCEALAAAERRRLVNACLDRGSLSALLGGDPALLPLHPVLPEYDDSEARAWFPQDIPAYEIEILTEDYDGDGTLEYFRDGLPTPFGFQLLVCSENEAATAAARSIADELRARGIRLELRLLGESAFLQAVRNRDYDAYLASIRLTADFDLTALYGSAGDDLMRVFAESFRSSEGEERLSAARSLGAYGAECALVLPLAFLRRTICCSRGEPDSMEPSWLDPFRKLTEWRVRG